VRVSIRASILVVICFTVCVMLAGCGSESCGPQPCQCGITLENIWPNDDGRGWEYEYTWRTWDDTCEAYTNLDDVPPAPSLDYIENLLGRHPIGEDVTTRVGSYAMWFDGDSTTMSGVTAQALRDSAYFPEGHTALSAGAASTRAFLEAYVAGRFPQPDDTFGTQTGVVSDIVLTPTPILVHGGAWEKTDEYIGTYGDYDAQLAWKYLDASLCPDSDFSFNITGAAGNGLVVRCRVLGETSIQTEMGVFQNGLNCLYVVDLGVMAYDGAHGSIQYRRHITYGNVIYVPDVGPVYSYERFFVCVRDTLSRGAGDMTLSLMSTGTDR
jgi:hypothetical protein